MSKIYWAAPLHDKVDRERNDKYVATRSEGEEPYRKVVVYLKKN